MCCSLQLTAAWLTQAQADAREEAATPQRLSAKRHQREAAQHAVRVDAQQVPPPWVLLRGFDQLGGRPPRGPCVQRVPAAPVSRRMGSSRVAVNGVISRWAGGVPPLIMISCSMVMQLPSWPTPRSFKQA